MKELSQEQRKTLERFEAFAAKEGSQRKAADKIGITSAVISGLRNGSYNGDVDAQVKKIQDYFDLKDEAKGTYNGTAYRDTSVSHKVYGYIRNAQLKGGLIAVSGDAGIGKTQAIKQYHSDHPNDSVWITASPCMNAVKPVLKALCRQLGVSARTNDDMYLGIIDKLNDGMVLVFDEAQHLHIKTIEVLRGFSDYFSDRGMTLGIAFVGNIETINKFGGKEAAAFYQISNRTKQRPILHASDISKEDIHLLFPELEDEASTEFMLAIAQSKQAIRGCTNLYSNAMDNGNTAYNGLVAMAKSMEMRI